MKPTNQLFVPVLSLTAVALAAPASAGLFASTGQTGAQVQCDVNHTQSWTYSVAQDVHDVEGAIFVMKRGPQTTAMITFAIFEGTMADFGIAPSIMSVTLSRTNFSQAYLPVVFSSNPVTLLAGRTYTGVLFSGAADTQSTAYFIKGGSETNLRFVDDSGNDLPNAPAITAVPAPGALALIGAVGVVAGRRRR